MSRVQTIIDHAEQQCNAHGSRLTVKRKQVLKGLLKSDRALSAYELAEYCTGESGKPLAAMSVYRILEFLQDEQLVHKLNLANKFVACAHITCDHDHEIPQFLICRQCQMVSEIGISRPIIDEIQRNVENAGFHLVAPQLEINCLCESCKAAKN